MAGIKKFIFDVDGTLTPSRRRVNKHFQKWFWGFIQTNKTWLVTGSDYPKTLEQLGKDICEEVVTVYNCSGNETRFRGKIVNASSWQLPDSARHWLEMELVRSPFLPQTGNHIEERRGCVNFSIVGRNATAEQRLRYIKYDRKNNDRLHTARTFNYVFGSESLGLTAQIGGETGLDIYPIGRDKAQILDDFSKDDEIYFFGDKMEIGGNDWSLANALKDYPNARCFQVKDWQDTWETLNNVV